MYEVVKPDRTGEVISEGLFHHYPGVVHQVGVAQHGDHGVGGLGWHGQVVQPPRPRTEQRLGLLHRRRQTVRSATLGHVGQPLREPLPRVGVYRVHSEAVDGRPGEGAELVEADVLHRRAHDPDVRRERRLREVGKTRQQLSLGQVTRRPEQDDDMGCQRVEVTPERTRARRGISDGLETTSGISHAEASWRRTSWARYPPNLTSRSAADRTDIPSRSGAGTLDLFGESHGYRPPRTRTRLSDRQSSVFMCHGEPPAMGQTPTNHQSLGTGLCQALVNGNHNQ